MPSFAIVDSHVHLYDPTWLRYGWLAKVPRIDRRYDLGDFDRCRAQVQVDRIVFAEVAVLAVNGWRCPLTGVAARFTDDRADNFDIYLPVWLARHNKVIFGGLYILGMVVTFAWWRGWLPR